MWSLRVFVAKKPGERRRLVTLLSWSRLAHFVRGCVTFLARWLGLPDQTTSLYVSLMTLTRYGQVIASVGGFAFLSFGVVLAVLRENSRSLGHGVRPDDT